MTHTEDTIEQIRFLAENWHRLSAWTQLQILIAVWWYVKVKRPMRRLAGVLGLSAAGRTVLIGLSLALLAGVASAALVYSPGGFQPPLSLSVALVSTGFVIGLGWLRNGR